MALLLLGNNADTCWFLSKPRQKGKATASTNLSFSSLLFWELFTYVLQAEVTLLLFPGVKGRSNPPKQQIIEGCSIILHELCMLLNYHCCIVCENDLSLGIGWCRLNRVTTRHLDLKEPYLVCTSPLSTCQYHEMA